VVTGSIAVGADSDWFKFTASAGQMVRVGVQPGTSGGLHLRVGTEPGGDSLLIDSYYPPAVYGSNFTAAGWVTLPSAGTYYIEVRADPIDGTSGTYTLDLRSISRTATTAALDHRDIVLIRS